MRQFINITTGKSLNETALPGAGSVTPQAVYDKAVQVAALAGRHYEFRKKWDTQWVQSLKSRLASFEASHHSAEGTEVDFDPDYVAKPFVELDVMNDVLAMWWGEKSDFVYDLVGDVKHACDYYQTAHPMAESSDEMSLLRSEKNLANTVEFHGGLGDIYAMDRVLTAMDIFLEDVARYQITGASICTQHTETLIKAGLPVIMWFAAKLGARGSAEAG